MNYDFYSTLSPEEQIRYDNMLRTQYILLRTDECPFEEEDETGLTSVSVSYVHSIRHAKHLWGMEDEHYPQGSMSANALYVDALIAYHGGSMPETADYHYLRSAIQNLLRLRRDDSSPHCTRLFGSSYSIVETRAGKDLRRSRYVEVSMRHTAAALHLLFLLSANRRTTALDESSVAFVQRARQYLTSPDAWNQDPLRALTIASVRRTLLELVPLYDNISRTLDGLACRCEKLLTGPECIVGDISGDRFTFPSPAENALGAYEFYLTGSVLALTPDLMANENIQRVLMSILENEVDWMGLKGLPVHRRTLYPMGSQITPDFGMSVLCLRLMWYCLEHHVGDADWQDYCGARFASLLQYCLAAYQCPEAYVYPYNESTANALFMPQQGSAPEMERKVDEFIRSLQHCVAATFVGGRRRLDAELRHVPVPSGLSHTAEIIRLWRIEDHCRSEKSWERKKAASDVQWGSLGAFAGGFSYEMMSRLLKARHGL
jgi:hypothetical protein